MMKMNLQYFGHLMWTANTLEKTLMLGKIEGRRSRGWQRTRRLYGIIDSMEMNLSKLQETVKDRKAWHAAVQGVSKSQTQLSDCTTATTFLSPTPVYHQFITLPSTWEKIKTITQELLVSPWLEPQTYLCCYYSFLLFWYKMKHPSIPCFRFHALSLYWTVSLWVIHCLLHHQLLLFSKIDLISIPFHTKYHNVCLS